MYKLFTISMIALVLFSCNSSGERKTTDTTPSYPTSLSTPPAQTADSDEQGNLGTTPTAPITITPASSNGVTLNPAHGAPGHRCDIAVGQPLNGSASTVPTS